MNVPENLKYTKTHEWIKVLDNGTVEIGLSDYAQQEMGDIVFVNLPKSGQQLEAGSVFADVESVKAVSDIYSPINGQVKEINQNLLNAPELINKSPYSAWLIRAEGVILDGELLSAAEYQTIIK
ncbi:MAG: glycine cleavage system protein GcvH [Treponema sp.]|nr:glycine cleavage system protein GcvH [Treponema sp.]